MVSHKESMIRKQQVQKDLAVFIKTQVMEKHHVAENTAISDIELALLDIRKLYVRQLLNKIKVKTK